MLRNWVKRALSLVMLVALAMPASAQTSRDVNAFIFGNSLVYHDGGGAETAVPYWLDLLAEAGGHGWAVDGQWGFLSQFALNLPPEPQWRFDGVDQVWENERFGFRRVPFDTIILTPANFVQYQPASEPYDGDNTSGDSPLSASGRIIDWSASQARGARFFVYEGWADMATVVDYPPDARGLAEYLEANRGDYHDWYVEFVEALQYERPQLEITLIPVATVLADVLQDSVLSELSAEDLYSDDAPHGTPTLYFLAAMITYSALYADGPPTNVELPDSLHPVLRDNYGAVAAHVWAAFSGGVVPELDEAAVQVIPETGLSDPSLALGLNGIADWSTQQPFINVMKTARPWIGHLPDQWGGYEMADLIAGGYLDADGWPIAIPDEVVAIEAFVLTDQPAGATSIAGRYIVTWTGAGDLTIGGTARNVEYEDDRITFDYRAEEGLVAVRIESVDPDNPIRDIEIVREDLLPLHEVGVLFNPDWIVKIRDVRMVRFMDWMSTNGSLQTVWEDRPTPDDFSYVWRGAPVEVMVELSNFIGADPWFTMPHMADDDYNRAFATVVKNTLEPDLVAHVEWSNEVWNFIFPQAVWARDQAIARWGESVQDDAWMQFAGLRAAEVMGVWSGVFDGELGRIHRIVGTHSGWVGLEESLLEADLVQADGLPKPAEAFDGYAITGYFGFEIGEDDMGPVLHRWIDQGTAAANVTEMLRNGSFTELTDEIFPYHAGVAERYGFTLHMYEGGTHVAGHGEQTGDDELTAFYNSYNYSPDMAALYADLMQAWRAQGGGPFNAFVDVSAPSQFGSWGALRHLEDVNARWSTMQGFNAVPFGDDRAGTAFVHGVTRIGDEAADVLEGTEQHDVLIGWDGDDRFRPGAGVNRIHGGAGFDTVQLAGVETDYMQGWVEDVLLVAGSDSVTYIVDVEALEFEGTPGQVVSLEIAE